MSKMSVAEKIDFFFMKPNFNDNRSDYSPLFLLRKHVDISLGFDPKQPVATWPGAMAILAGIDMLSLYFTGNLEVKNKDGQDIEICKSERHSFIGFCDNFLGITTDDSETIYMLRNALLHTYGLVTTNEIRKCFTDNTVDNPNYLKKYWFSAIFEKDIHYLLEMTREDDFNRYFNVNIWILYDHFNLAIENYRSLVETDAQARKNFEFIFDKFGVYSYGPIN